MSRRYTKNGAKVQGRTSAEVLRYGRNSYTLQGTHIPAFAKKRLSKLETNAANEAFIKLSAVQRNSKNAVFVFCDFWDDGLADGHYAVRDKRGRTFGYCANEFEKFTGIRLPEGKENGKWFTFSMKQTREPKWYKEEGSY